MKHREVKDLGSVLVCDGLDQGSHSQWVHGAASFKKLAFIE